MQVQDWGAVVTMALGIGGAVGYGAKRAGGWWKARGQERVRLHALALERSAVERVRADYQGASAEVPVRVQLKDDLDRAAGDWLVAQGRARLDADGNACFLVDRLEPGLRQIVDRLDERDRRVGPFGRSGF